MKEIDWEAVLEDQKECLKNAMMKDLAWTLGGSPSSPYTFEILDFQERIGEIEQENYEEAYKLLVEEYSEEYFDDFLL